jgi:hypothetical protein
VRIATFSIAEIPMDRSDANSEKTQVAEGYEYLTSLDRGLICSILIVNA